MVAVTVRNVTAEPLHVMNVKLSSQQPVIDFDETIPPGASATRTFPSALIHDMRESRSLGQTHTHATTTYTRPGDRTLLTSAYVLR
jgi:hypothetical protein